MTTSRIRYPLVDALRGLALLAMAVYHGSWDLSYQRLVDWDVAGEPAWRAFAVAIATTFLTLSGVSLALSARGGVNARAFALRVVKIAAAAGLISLATWTLFPDAWIFFGVLHMIALGSVLALPFLTRPPWLALAVAAVVAALPALDGTGLFHDRRLAFTGLSSEVPASNDLVPIFPWFAAMLAGVAVGRLVATGLIRLPAGPARGPIRPLAALGRWSLVFYLVHQPVLFGAAALAAAVLPADPAGERATFVGDCVATCGLDGEACARFCGCVADRLEETPFFTVRGGRPGMAADVSAAAEGCRGVVGP